MKGSVKLIVRCPSCGEKIFFFSVRGIEEEVHVCAKCHSCFTVMAVTDYERAIVKEHRRK